MGSSLGWRALFPRIIAMALVLANVWNAFECVWIHGIWPRLEHEELAAMVLFFQVLSYTCLLFCWLCLYFFYHVFDRLNRSEIERFKLMSTVKEAELRALKSQVNPHFIFTSLNSKSGR